MRISGKTAPLAEGQVRLAAKIADRILRAQRRMGDYLNTRTADISPGQWRIMLLAFCLLFGGYSLYLLIDSFI